MTPERWHQLEQLYHRALEYPADRRSVFLEEACGAERTLRHEVESLLAYDTRAARYLATRALDMPASIAGKRPPDLPSNRIRVALVDRSRIQPPGELYDLLLRRLRICGSIMTAALAALMGLHLWNVFGAIEAGAVEELGAFPSSASP